MKGMVRFYQNGYLSPHYVDPYEILQRISKVVYELKLPSELALVHRVFHVSMLKKYDGNLEIILPIKGRGLWYNLSYEQVPVEFVHL